MTCTVFTEFWPFVGFLIVLYAVIEGVTHWIHEWRKGGRS